jgi:hypothetical protein
MPFALPFCHPLCHHHPLPLPLPPLRPLSITIAMLHIIIALPSCPPLHCQCPLIGPMVLLPYILPRRPSTADGGSSSTPTGRQCAQAGDSPVLVGASVQHQHLIALLPWREGSSGGVPRSCQGACGLAAAGREGGGISSKGHAVVLSG